jgi:hypothetical protein
MSPKAEDFITDDLLKSIDKTQCHNHYGHAECCGANSQSNDEAGKGLPVFKGNPFGNEQ